MTTQISAVVFLKGSGAPAREAVEAALADLAGSVEWKAQGERGPTARVAFEQHVVGLALAGVPLGSEAYAEHLTASGLSDEERGAIEGHGSHVRCVSMPGAENLEPCDRMSAVYKVASRLSAMDGIAVLAPESGVFVLGLGPEHVDCRLEEGVPPLDLYVQVEVTGKDRARTVGASVIDVPDVELHGIEGLDPETVYGSALGVVAYLERIRRELVPGETLQLGEQPWHWETLKGKTDLVVLRRVVD